MANVASLPMYDIAEVRDLTERWWAGLSRHFMAVGIEDVPTHLYRPRATMAHWLNESLLFSQTCGYPLTHALRGRVTLIGTPEYSVPGCCGSDYSSALLVRASAGVASLEDLRGRIAACNAADSHSGYSVLRAMIAPLAHDGRFFASVTITGSHVNSVAAVAKGGADVCAVDAVSYALLKRYRPICLDNTRLLTWSVSAPGLPYISRRAATATLVADLREGIAAAFADPRLNEVRSGLFLGGFGYVTETDYEPVLQLERTARDHCYQELN